MNWTGHVLVAPRSRIGEALQREEATQTGVYFLVGDDPDHPTKDRVYIGEGDSVADRIKSHVKDASKDFWTRACFVTAKDTNLTKAHVRYLESRFVQITKQADRANLANGNEPSAKDLPKSDVADMEFCVGQVQVILPVVGFDFLRRIASTAAAYKKQDDGTRTAVVELVLTGQKYGYQARAVEESGEITVLAGSQALVKNFPWNDYGLLRDQLIRDGGLVPSGDPRLLRFAEDVSFSSPSAAASVIKNRNTNGLTSWKLQATGQTLKDWQNAQLLPVMADQSSEVSE